MMVGPGSGVNEYCGFPGLRGAAGNHLKIKEASMCFQWVWMVGNL